METSNTAVAPAASRSNFYHHQHHKNNSNSDQSNSHHHAILTFHAIIIITVSVISVVVLVALLLLGALMLMRKRLTNKSSKDIHGTSSFDDIGGAGGGSSRFISHTTINFTTCSPDVKGGGCLYGGHVRSSFSTNVPTAAAASVRYKGVVQVFTYKELEMATGRFSESNVIRNNGGFWTVYRGVLSDGTVAAVKKFHRDGKQVERAFRMEVDLLSSLHSPYLVELLGYCADQNHRLLVSAYIPNGTLQQHLHNPNNHYQPLDWGTRLIIALDCARALEFLHEQATPPVIHRDLNSSNVLLDQNFRGKLTDFGLAKMVSDKINGQISTRVLGTSGYLAPEYASTGKLTTKSDVYSYGVVLLELLTGRVPVDTNRPPGEQVLVSWALPRLTSREKVVEMVDPSLQGQYSKKDLAQVAAIAAVCVQPEADYRPLMTDVVQSLIPLVKNNANGAMCFRSSRFQQQTPSPRHLQKI